MHSLGQAMRAVLLQFESREAKFFPLAQGAGALHQGVNLLNDPGEFMVGVPYASALLATRIR
jgi:hypothetical protein